ncbi:MAG TPA: hypothetical protein VKA62_07980, partial [Agromyces sp.]|nr:hypothetical protein [Agromyces sp.]
MPDSRDADPLGGLDQSARRAQPRVRIAVGAAVTLFIAAVAVAALLSFGAGGGGEQPLIDGSGVEPGPSAGAPEPVTVGAAPLLVHVLGA